MDHETFWTLMRDRAHWEFELFVMVVFDGLLFGLLWPFCRKCMCCFGRDKKKAATP